MVAATLIDPPSRLTLPTPWSRTEWRNRRIIALSPVQDIAIRGLANRYRRPGIGAPLAASTQPIVAEQGVQVAPRMKLPMTALLRLDAPRRQLVERELRATLDLYNTYDVAKATIGGKTVPLEADDTAVLAYVLASPEIWERELKAFFSGVFSEATPTQLASIDVYRPGRIPVVFVHGTASSAGRWGDMVNDLSDDPRIREHYQFWFFAAAIYSFAFLFPEQRYKPPSPYDPRLRLAADLYSFGLAHAFASKDYATVEFKSGGYQLPFGTVQVVVNPSAFGNMAAAGSAPHTAKPFPPM